MNESVFDPAAHAQIQRARRDLIGDAPARSVRRNPAREALRFEGRSWTYAQPDAAANRVATGCSASAWWPATASPPTGATPTPMLLWLGCVRAGLIHVPINPRYRRRAAPHRRAVRRPCAV